MKTKHCLILLLLLILASGLFAQPKIPRMYVRKLVLDNGKLPFVTWLDKVSAPEYLLEAWITDRPFDLLSTDTHTVHHLAVSQVGDGVKFPFTVIAKLQLGNFKFHWNPGETIHFRLTHKESGQVKEWEEIIPEGSYLMKHLDDPIVIPPYSKDK
ncbi:MAG: hypothetical protein ACOYIS_06985 [Candidatus Cloacimonadaceae bacterium]|jgi:hypothetical protein